MLSREVQVKMNEGPMEGHRVHALEPPKHEEDANVDSKEKEGADASVDLSRSWVRICEEPTLYRFRFCVY